MAITNFVPELWEASVLVPFDKYLVYGQPIVANRDYEGTLRNQGDTVHVTTIGAPTISTYSKTADLSIEDLSDSDSALVIDQGDYFAFRVNDVDAVQAAGDFKSPATELAGIGLRDKVDQYLARMYYAGAHADNKLGRLVITDGVPDKASAGQTAAYTALVKLREKLDKKSVPTEGRYVIVPPEFVSCLLYDRRYTDLSGSGSTDALLNGQVGRASGFNVLVSNNVQTVTQSGGTGVAAADLVITAGVPSALSFANQLTKVTAVPEEKRFAEIVKGLNIYGAKVFRPEGIATATVSFAVPVVA